MNFIGFLQSTVGIPASNKPNSYSVKRLNPSGGITSSIP
jgi:hypothetical protein